MSDAPEAAADVDDPACESPEADAVEADVAEPADEADVAGDAATDEAVADEAAADVDAFCPEHPASENAKRAVSTTKAIYVRIFFMSAIIRVEWGIMLAVL